MAICRIIFYYTEGHDSCEEGSIISTVSIAWVISCSGKHSYKGAKHAVVGMTKNTAAELGQFGIRVNCVSPYGIATPLGTAFAGGLSKEELEGVFAQAANLKGVMLKEEDIANATLYLASDESKYVSGHNLVVDGGYAVTKLGSLPVYSSN